MAKTMPLSRGEVAIVDDGDYDYLSQWKWYCAATSSNLKYAVRKVSNGDGTWTRYLMHRVIMGEPENMLIDHISGNGLDNRRENLREATPSQNQINRRISPKNKSGQRGVRWHKYNKQWEASIRVDGKWTYLGMSKDLWAAISMRKLAEEKYYGEFVRKES